MLGALVEAIADISRARHHHRRDRPSGRRCTHPLIVFAPADNDQRARADAAYGEVTDLTIKLGGTITGEDGVGRLKRGWPGAYLGEDVLALNHKIKNALDPLGILNPGAAI